MLAPSAGSLLRLYIASRLPECETSPGGKGCATAECKPYSIASAEQHYAEGMHSDAGHTYQQVKPASTLTIAPVIRLAAPDARKRTALATSSGVPIRPIGVSASQTGMRS